MKWEVNECGAQSRNVTVAIVGWVKRTREAHREHQYPIRVPLCRVRVGRASTLDPPYKLRRNSPIGQLLCARGAAAAHALLEIELQRAKRAFMLLYDLRQRQQKPLCREKVHHDAVRQLDGFR